jgi:hypothetical protein
MSMSSPHPILDPNAQAKSMIDAVTGHPAGRRLLFGKASNTETEIRRERCQISSDGKRVVTRVGGRTRPFLIQLRDWRRASVPRFAFRTTAALRSSRLPRGGWWHPPIQFLQRQDRNQYPWRLVDVPRCLSIGAPSAIARKGAEDKIDLIVSHELLFLVPFCYPIR